MKWVYFKIKICSNVSIDKNAFHQIFPRYLETDFSDLTIGFVQMGHKWLVRPDVTNDTHQKVCCISNYLEQWFLNVFKLRTGTIFTFLFADREQSL